MAAIFRRTFELKRGKETEAGAGKVARGTWWAGWTAKLKVMELAGKPKAGSGGDGRPVFARLWRLPEKQVT
jgi:hypothetical protein